MQKAKVWVPLALLTLTACSGVPAVNEVTTTSDVTWSNLNATRTGVLANPESAFGDIVTPTPGAEIVTELPESVKVVPVEEPVEVVVEQVVEVSEDPVVTEVAEPVVESVEAPVVEAPVVEGAPAPVIEEVPAPIVEEPAPAPPEPAPVANQVSAGVPHVSLPYCGVGGQGLVDSCGGFTNFAPYTANGFSTTYAIHWELGGWQLPTTPGSIVEVQGVGKFRVTGIFATLSYNYHDMRHLPYGTAPYFFQTCLYGDNNQMIFIGAEPI